MGDYLGRKGAISDSDMEYQLAAMTLHEPSLKRDPASVGQAVNIHLPGAWEARVKEYLADLQAGPESLNAIHQDEDERQEIFGLKSRL